MSLCCSLFFHPFRVKQNNCAFHMVFHIHGASQKLTCTGASRKASCQHHTRIAILGDCMEKLVFHIVIDLINICAAFVAHIKYIANVRCLLVLYSHVNENKYTIGPTTSGGDGGNEGAGNVETTLYIYTM